MDSRRSSHWPAQCAARRSSDGDRWRCIRGDNRFNKRTVLEYRARRLSLGITVATINRDLGRLSGMFSFLCKADRFTAEHPLRGLGKLEEKHPEMTYLSLPEVTRLLSMLEGEERCFALCAFISRISARCHCVEPTKWGA